ncbi:ATP-binding protein [Aestuariivirga sp.]|uniref:ATP-binding protein n=1 Tax=Aestuariivirga sp. TaxID=2650926 RepID=UPI0039E3CD16
MTQDRTLTNRFNRFLERHLPGGLYKRALIILIAPIVLLQTIMAVIILDRHWDNVTKALGRSLSMEIGMLVDDYQRSDRSAAAIEAVQERARSKLRLDMDVIRNADLPPVVDPPFYALFERKMQKYLTRDTGRAFWVSSSGPDGQVEVQVEVDKGTIFRIRTESERAQASGTGFLLALMLAASGVLLGVAMIFLRKQVKPILELAEAAKNFGLGRDTSNFHPRGADEIRAAGNAFLDMRRRIARHVEQRTDMLAGVSHDLRTILTRFKLELAVLGDNPKVHPLKEDVDEMQHMLEDYMAFVKGDGGEQATDVNVPDAVRQTVDNVERDRPDSDAVVRIDSLPQVTVRLKANAFRRLLANLISNAVRYGHKVQISGEVRDHRLWLNIDDNGPGIPPHQREQAFRPFVRLDNARNLDETGTGLGLAIAQDIAHAHGGEIMLEDGPLGGLRAIVKLPV